MVFCTAVAVARASCGLDPRKPPEMFLSNARIQVPWVGISLIDSRPVVVTDGAVGPQASPFPFFNILLSSLTRSLTHKHTNSHTHSLTMTHK